MSRARRRAREEVRADPHRWLVSYADFITLLFAFFVVLYAISTVDAAKWADVVMVLTPDEFQSQLYQNDIEPNLKDGAPLAFAHGFGDLEGGLWLGFGDVRIDLVPGVSSRYSPPTVESSLRESLSRPPHRRTGFSWPCESRWPEPDSGAWE